jgi:hypothetical protein
VELTVLAIGVLATQQLVQVDEASDSWIIVLPVDVWVARILNVGEACVRVGDPFVDPFIETRQRDPPLAVVVVTPKAKEFSVRVPRRDPRNVQ